MIPKDQGTSYYRFELSDEWKLRFMLCSLILWEIPSQGLNELQESITDIIEFYKEQAMFFQKRQEESHLLETTSDIRMLITSSIASPVFPMFDSDESE